MLKTARIPGKCWASDVRLKVRVCTVWCTLTETPADNKYGSRSLKYSAPSLYTSTHSVELEALIVSCCTI